MCVNPAVLCNIEIAVMPTRAFKPIPQAVCPSKQQSLADYKDLASGYDATCEYVTHVRLHAIEQLDVKRGQVVLDIACGTGATLLALAERVGATGKVLGVEQSPDMAALARQRIESHALKAAIELHVTAAEELNTRLQADAVLMCFTQDVLQNPQALKRIFSCVKPGASLAVTGVRLQPWLYAWPINLWALARSKSYFTTTRGLMQPWAPLLAYCPDLKLQRTYHMGLTYLASGHYQPKGLE